MCDIYFTFDLNFEFRCPDSIEKNALFNRFSKNGILLKKMLKFTIDDRVKSCR